MEQGKQHSVSKQSALSVPCQKKKDAVHFFRTKINKRGGGEVVAPDKRTNQQAETGGSRRTHTHNEKTEDAKAASAADGKRAWRGGGA